MAQLVKTIAGLAVASCKTINGLAIASVKTVAGLDNTAGGGTPAFVEWANATPEDSASTLSFNITVAAGATLVCATGWEDADRTVSCSSNVDGAFTALTEANQGGQIYGQMFYKIGLTAGAHTITFDYGATTAFVKGGGMELSGVTAIDEEAIPGTGTTGAVGDPADTGNINTDNAVEVLACFCMNYNGRTITPQTSWTSPYNIAGFSSQHFTTESTGTFHGEATFIEGDAPYVIFMAAFK